MNAKRDENHVATKLGVLYSDGVTLVPIAVNPSTGRTLTVIANISFTPNPNAIRDENYEHVLLAISSVDGSTVPIYVDENGKVLIDS